MGNKPGDLDHSFEAVRFAGAATYRITVQGRLPSSWSERLAGMRVLSAEDQGGSSQQTVLEGVLRDQSDLSNVLNSLYSLHLPILRVEQIDNTRQ